MMRFTPLPSAFNGVEVVSRSVSGKMRNLDGVYATKKSQQGSMTVVKTQVPGCKLCKARLRLLRVLRNTDAGVGVGVEDEPAALAYRL